MNAVTQQSLARPERRRLANAIRALSMDAVEAANSGHPGAPMGLADVAEVLWNDFLAHSPNNPRWVNRDRFVLSNGHASMLLYSLLHLSGYDLPMEQLRQFRQLHSLTPGHPEAGETPGVETTTGPLGQGLANAVGMALAERLLAAEFNRDNYEIIDHRTYCIVGDGCLMEGISHEACSLAGTLGLGKLVVVYDDNAISIDGDVAGWFKDDTPARFRAYGWHVVADVDGHDPEAVLAALEEARHETVRPSLICCKTQIGSGAPNKGGTAGVHGAPLGSHEIAATREQLDWHHQPFDIPGEIAEAWDARSRGDDLEAAWQQAYGEYKSEHPTLAAELERRLAGALPAAWSSVFDRAVGELDPSSHDATRKLSQKALGVMAEMLPELLGGSADLSGSNGSLWSGARAMNATAIPEESGNYLHYGVREFATSAIINGVALHGGYIPFAATFLVFSDYARNAIRLAALMRLRSIFVLTHDSIGLGEDGPTHQPVEHLASLRLVPNLDVWRPADALEVFAAWHGAVERDEGPSALALTRQGVATQDLSNRNLTLAKRGAYVLFEPSGPPVGILIATGSEVELAVEAASVLAAEGYPFRVVSAPCLEVFKRQPRDYQDSVLPPGLRLRIAVEAGVTSTWREWVGLDGAVVGLDTFGASAPAKTLYEHYGITAEAIAATARELVEARR